MTTERHARRVHAPTVGPFTVPYDTVRERLEGSLHTALNLGLLTGTTIVQDGGLWRCWTWQEVGPKWIALAVAESDDEAEARAMAADRLVAEVAKHPTA